MERLPLLIAICTALFVAGSGAIASDDGIGDSWETKTIADALGKGTLKVRIVEDARIRERLGYFSVPVLNPAGDESLVVRCSDAIRTAVEKDDAGLLVGELRQDGRAYWYVYGTSIEVLDGAFESIADSCPIMWGNHHDRDWSEYAALRTAS